MTDADTAGWSCNCEVRDHYGDPIVAETPSDLHSSECLDSLITLLRSKLADAERQTQEQIDAKHRIIREYISRI